MKRLILTIFIVFIFFSCGDIKYYDVSITNNSTKTVSYIYNGHSDVITISETKNYEVKAHTQPPQNVLDQNEISSIRTTKQNLEYVFSDAIPFDLNVVNTLPIDVNFIAGNFIDYNGSNELQIEAYSEITTAKIYISNPSFTSLIDYPVIINWNFCNDSIFVIIR
jgi:hypothetical protein